MMSYQYSGCETKTSSFADKRILQLETSIRGYTLRKHNRVTEFGHANIHVISGRLDSDIYIDLARHISTHLVTMLSFVNYDLEQPLSAAEDHWPEVSGSVAYIDRFEIYPRFQQQGLGTDAFADILKLLKNLRVSYVFLTPFPLHLKRYQKSDVSECAKPFVERLVHFYSKFEFKEWLHNQSHRYMYSRLNSDYPKIP